MARREWRDAGKERFWRRMVQEFKRSGLSVRDFCSRRSLAEHNFYAWRRIVAQRDQEAANSNAAGEAPTPRFLPVHIRPDVAAAQPIDVVLGNGRCLRVPPGFDAEALRKLLAVVEEAPSC